eukprot:TRINITY_DN27708_c0_g1_i1.p1 TRINITY_DN27708_c0_g1~~TRINITY_DN27708_c0_g1_i1.p1  ORF type:complete len:571 (+),score=167.11 TRINITY_DN27708_c0_g1_i1:76-1788(+)
MAAVKHQYEKHGQLDDGTELAFALESYSSDDEADAPPAHGAPGCVKSAAPDDADDAELAFAMEIISSDEDDEDTSTGLPAQVLHIGRAAGETGMQACAAAAEGAQLEDAADCQLPSCEESTNVSAGDVAGEEADEEDEDAEGDGRPREFPPPADRGEPPAGTEMLHGACGHYLVATRSFEAGEVVFRDRGILRPPSELPPLEMFRPLPKGVGDVPMKADGFPEVATFEHLNLFLLYAFLQASKADQADTLAMQDDVADGAECGECVDIVSKHLHAKQLPWLEELSLELLARLLRIFCVNSFSCHAAGEGGARTTLYKWGTIMNCSCNANVTMSSEAADGQAWGVWRARRKIAAGEELCNSYASVRMELCSVEQRRRMLWWWKGFECMCERCRAEAAHGDEGRVLRCPECSADFVWRPVPDKGGVCGFLGSCSHELPACLLEEELIATKCMVAALASKTPPAPLVVELRRRCQPLPSEHRARRLLALIDLAAETPSEEEAVLAWLYRVWESEVWFRNHSGAAESSRLAQGGLAQCRGWIRLAECVLERCPPERSDDWLQELCSWAEEAMIV